jgi:hypothetical protein
LNTRAFEGVEDGVVADELEEGEGELPVPTPPQADAVIKIAPSASQRLMREKPHQLCTRALPVKVT